MNREYKEWINENYPTEKAAKNKCNEAVRKMMDRFNPLENFIGVHTPDNLVVQVGYCNEIYHCWLKDTRTGCIVDPTAKQFDEPLKYRLVAERFLDKGEIEPSTGAFFLQG